MQDDYGPDFYTVTDEDGNEIELEFVAALEHDGQQYIAFFPAESLDEEDRAEEELEEEAGLVILKVIEEDGEEIFSTLDDDEELNTVYDLFMEQIFNEEDEED